MSLRAELVESAGGMPAFAVLLPTGWEASDASFRSMRPRLEAVLDQLPESNRAVLRSRIEGMLASARAEATRAEIVRVFAPAGVAPEEFVPVSLVASWLRAPKGGSLQDVGSGLISSRGAAPLDPGGTILRWPMEQTVAVEDGEVEVAGAGYLLPVPGHPSVGLMFRSQILRDAGGARLPDEGEQTVSRLCDAIVASVRWRRD
ncbi:hypothetical protein DY023_04185 [Microbacterium bovistercoris]|uniref:Uncharacterized protein n=1 Tax=Microbacterium bovistercoris TaxID=2293570 RepID=A0A371NW84_9MICO|nr:hypothetical protein [Microbacterium bovistercoris]REJ07202.1 hypothetical protein DY023_04185 [Microbacterium bovistercoris]